MSKEASGVEEAKMKKQFKNTPLLQNGIKSTCLVAARSQAVAVYPIE